MDASATDTAVRDGAVEVALVSWPAEADWLERLRRSGQPRLLLVRDDADPPVNEDELEDWVRTPADPIEVHARVAVLKVRAARFRPSLDDSGRLNVGSRWIDLSPIEYRLVGLLLEHFGTLVSRDELLRAAWPTTRPSNNQLDVYILRLRRRLQPTGLRLRTVRSRGYSLDHSEQRGFVRRALSR